MGVLPCRETSRCRHGELGESNRPYTSPRGPLVQVPLPESHISSMEILVDEEVSRVVAATRY
jgi:hypothetical protein